MQHAVMEYEILFMMWSSVSSVSYSKISAAKTHTVMSLDFPTQPTQHCCYVYCLVFETQSE